MDSVKIFNGYGKVDNNLENQSHPSSITTSKSKKFLITITSILLLTVIIVASLLALIHHTNTESESESSESESSSSSSSKLNSTESIKLVCNVTRYPDSCFNSISSLNASPKPDPVSIFKLSLRVSIAEFSSLTSFVKTLNRNDSALNDCAELFDEAVARLNESMALTELVHGVFTEKTVSDVQTWVSAALTDQDTCMDGLEEMESTALIEVKRKVQKCSEYVSNTLAIVANIRLLLQKFGLTLH